MSSKSARRPISLALRLTLLYGALVAALLITVVLSLRAAIIANDSADFASNIQTAFDRVHKYRNMLEANVDRSDDHFALRALTPKGEVFFESEWMHRELPASMFPPPNQTRDITLPDGRWFTLVQSVREGWTYQYGIDRSSVWEVERSTYRLALLIGLPLMVVALAAGYALTRAGLRPLERLAEQFQSVSVTPPSKPFAPGPLPRELRPVADSFEAVFTRLTDTLLRLDAFAGDVAHELRTPLHRLRAAAEIALSADRTPEELKLALAQVIEDADSLATLIERFLLLARLEDPRQALMLSTVDVASELRDVAEFFGPVAQSKGIALEVAPLDSLPFPLDKALFQRAISNLVANAIAHTPAGGSIHLSAELAPPLLCVRVADTGVGIQPEHAEHLFDRTAARRSGGPGAGLGLRIVRRITELHRGSIELTSPPGRGVVATMRFLST